MGRDQRLVGDVEHPHRALRHGKPDDQQPVDQVVGVGGDAVAINENSSAGLASQVTGTAGMHAPVSGQSQMPGA